MFWRGLGRARRQPFSFMLASAKAAPPEAQGLARPYLAVKLALPKALALIM